jgi:hypothetical protein
VRGLVEWGSAAGTSIHSGVRHMFVVLASIWSFGPLFTKDAELLCRTVISI